jgi:flagellar protein FliL
VKKLLPVILAILGLAAGTGAGMMLKPGKDSSAQAVVLSQDGAGTENAETTGETASGKEKPVRRSEQDEAANQSGFEYVKLNNQFVVPVVNGSKVAALIVMSLSIEVRAGQKEVVFSREPKLRDAFLQVLFNHANSGGFDGAFTSGEKMNDLRGSLFEAAVEILGPIASDVLVMDIVRQDV